jgi:hypothetical protein
MTKLPGLQFLSGLKTLLNYRKEDWPHDLRAGLTVAAVALPISFANAQIAGFSPVVGLYSFLLPMAVYVLLGTSRHLIIGPDAATAALVASAIAACARQSRAVRDPIRCAHHDGGNHLYRRESAPLGGNCRFPLPPDPDWPSARHCHRNHRGSGAHIAWL